jgi:asparagine synthase (glutamine-hydrolysing)
MCGFAGFHLVYYPYFAELKDKLETIAVEMVDRLSHRGLDSFGAWSNLGSGIGFGHRRLSILDLSPAGHQPMVSGSGRFVIAFNGEIYNHLNLRTQLSSEGFECAWRGHSDTETLLAGFEHWGVVATLSKCVGMFAFALWDKANQVLTLGRDRFGEKPLYYGWSGGAFLFGSELKALRAFPGFAAEVSREALSQYLRFCYVPAPRSIYEGIYKLEPGCVLTIAGRPPSSPPAQPIRPGERHGSLAIARWCSFSETVENGVAHQHGSESGALSELEAALEESVQLQSLADVPLGAFLSGGVDSSAIVALMQKQSSRPVKTFTIGFDEAGFDESPHAKAVAGHLGTEHHEMRVSAKMAQNVIPQLPWIYDEPFADSSQIPTHLVCKAAKEHVTVALSGDAGDELFGGYNRYSWGPRIWEKLGSLPYGLRQGISKSISLLPEGAWNTLGAPLAGSEGGVVRLGEKLYKLSRSLRGAHSLDDLYQNLISTWDDPAALVRPATGERIIEPRSLTGVGSTRGPECDSLGTTVEEADARVERQLSTGSDYPSHGDSLDSMSKTKLASGRESGNSSETASGSTDSAKASEDKGLNANQNAKPNIERDIEQHTEQNAKERTKQNSGQNTEQSIKQISGPLRMMYLDTLSYLPDDILCKVDRAAMACSLETRVPFLDHRVVEQAWRLPLDMKFRDGQGKWALRQILYKYVPKELIERPKAGFAVPIGQWLRGPLRDWAEDLLSEKRLQSEGYIHPEPIRKVWKEHLTGRRDHTARLWTILMFQSWLESTRGNH